MGHPLYADGTPLKVKIAFDDGQTHEYKRASWHKLRVVGYQPPEPPARSALQHHDDAEHLVHDDVQTTAARHVQRRGE